jgi:putative transposase
VQRITELSKVYPRLGFRRIAALIPGVNIKAIHRIWKQEGLKLTRKVRRQIQRNKLPTIDLTQPHQQWCMDFIHTTLTNGKQLRILAVLDCFTRECLALRAATHFPANRVRQELDWTFLLHQAPQRILSDNGTEFRALKLPEPILHDFIQPGSPWQNGRVESFFDKLRDELLNREIFHSIQALQNALDQHQYFYNHQRPHRSLNNQTPIMFKQSQQHRKLETGAA